MPPEQSFQPQFQPAQVPPVVDVPQTEPQFQPVQVPPMADVTQVESNFQPQFQPIQTAPVTNVMPTEQQFQQVQPIQPLPTVNQSSSALKIFVAVMFVALSTGSAFGFWKYNQVKKLLADNLAGVPAIVATTTNESASIDLNVATSSSIAVATSTPEPVVSQAKVSTTTISTPKSSVSNVKSEIDEFGVNLYTLKQGETKMTKVLDGKSVNVVYTRSNNIVSIEEVRKASSEGYTGVGDITTFYQIDLDMKDKLPAKIKDMENTFATECKDTPTDKDCLDLKTVIDYIKTNCVNLKTNKETSSCVVTGMMKASPFPDKIQVNWGPAK